MDLFNESIASDHKTCQISVIHISIIHF